MKTFVEMTWNDPPVRLESKVSVWLVIFAGTNFRKTGQIQVSKTLADCFHSQPCTTFWFVLLCLHSISISWIASVIAVKGTLADTVLLAAR